MAGMREMVAARDYVPLVEDLGDLEFWDAIAAVEKPEAIELFRLIDTLPAVERRQKRRALLTLLGLHPTSEAQIEIIDASVNDNKEPPDWETASMSLFRDGDPDQLAALLRKELPAPVEVTRIIGVMLRPNPEYRGYCLAVTRDKRKPHWPEAAADDGMKLRCARRYAALRAENPQKPRKAILHELMSEFDRKKSWVEDAITIDVAATVHRSQRMLGYLQDDENP